MSSREPHRWQAGGILPPRARVARWRADRARRRVHCFPGSPVLDGRSHVRATLLLLAVLLASAGCVAPTEEGGGDERPGLQLPAGLPSDGSQDEGAPIDEAYLELSAEPVRGDAPLTVRFEARLVGLVDAREGFDCPTLAWTLDGRDDGEVVLSQAEGCQLGQVARVFRLEHRYERARSYEASLRLIGLDLPPSNLVQVLVQGPTATPAPQLARAGPTIVIATPRPAGASGTRAPVSAEPSEPEAAAATRVASDLTASPEASGRDAAPHVDAPASPVRPVDPTRSVERPRPSATSASAATAEPSPPRAAQPGQSTRPAAARVLPADLYFLEAGHRALWRLSASDGDPEPVLPAGDPILDYAVASDGRIAYSRGDRLMLAEGNSRRVLTPTAASDMLWSRDGRHLAYSHQGRLHWGVPGFEPLEATDIDAEPLAWSPDGRRLLAREAAGLVIFEPEAEGTGPVRLPIDGVRSAGWLPGRDAVWLAGDGLRILGFEPAFAVSELLPPILNTGASFLRADDHLVTLVGAGDSRQVRILDLSAPEANSEALGRSILEDPDSELAWAPGGRFAALAGPNGLELFDPAAGLRLTLLRRPASRPSWHLSLR